MHPDPLEFVHAVNRDVSRSRDVRANIRAVLDTLATQLGSDLSFVMLLETGTERLVPVASTGLSVSDFRRLESNADDPFLKTVFDGEAPAIYKDSDLGFLPQAATGASLVAVPVAVASDVYGVLCSRFPKANGASRGANEKLLRVAASLMAQALRTESAVRGDRQKLIEENSHLKQELKEKYEFSQIIGTSSAMKQVYEQVTQVARSNATVLLRGESGTGKEMIANAIHYNSLRSKRPLVKINCAALPDTLIEAELFGHERGAFTGADRAKKGRFELADGGTLFLDEIGDLPLQTQIKLLRVLQEREFERLGGTTPIRANIRLITATNKNLEEAITRGEFREDLYYRLNVFTLHLPPLRERRSDILLLAEHFLEKYEIEHGKRIRRISTPAIDMLMSYHFPGNVRELENAVERAVLVCDSNVIHGHHLPPTLQTAEVSGTATDLSLSAAVAAFERDLIQDTLKSTKGNVAQAARTLDSTERILGYKIRKYGIDPLRFRR